MIALELNSLRVEIVLQIVLQQPGHFIQQDAPPPAPGASEALVRIRRIGVCGTDYHAFEGHQPFFTYPRILGHELERGDRERAARRARTQARRSLRRRTLLELRRMRSLPNGKAQLLRQPPRAGRSCGRRNAGIPGRAGRCLARLPPSAL